MPDDLDVASGHVHFSASCFNRTWEYLELKDRGTQETEAMIHCAHASVWHWLERPDVTNEKRSIGFWLLSRVYAEAGQGDRALHYAALSMEEAEAGPLEPFYLCYAYEAIARAYKVLANPHELGNWKARAFEELAKVNDTESRGLLETDLASL